MLTHDYDSSKDDSLKWATLRIFFLQIRPLLDIEHVG